MAKRMTVIFEDEALYTALKIEALREGRHSKDVIAEAVREWLEAREDAELKTDLEAARREWEREGGVPASEFFRGLDSGLER